MFIDEDRINSINSSPHGIRIPIRIIIAAFRSTGCLTRGAQIQFSANTIWLRSSIFDHQCMSEELIFLFPILTTMNRTNRTSNDCIQTSTDFRDGRLKSIVRLHLDPGSLSVGSNGARSTIVRVCIFFLAEPLCVC